MEKLIDLMLVAVSTFLIAAGGTYTLRQVKIWSKRVAVEKAHQGLDRLEPKSRKLTGSVLDF